MNIDFKNSLEILLLIQFVLYCIVYNQKIIQIIGLTYIQEI